jgi:hypothetical protein
VKLSSLLRVAEPRRGSVELIEVTIISPVVVSVKEI